MATLDRLTTALLVHTGAEVDHAIVGRIADAAIRLAGGDAERVEAWFTSERPRAFGDRRPSEVIREGEGERLLRYVDSLDAGAVV